MVRCLSRAYEDSERKVTTNGNTGKVKKGVALWPTAVNQENTSGADWVILFFRPTKQNW